MFAAVALAAYLVQPGDTLSGIAASHGVSLAAVESANPQIANFNLIYVGQSVKIPGGSSAVQSSSTSAGSYSTPRSSYRSYPSSTGGASSAGSASSASQGSSSQQATPSYRSPSSISSATTRTSSGTSSGYSSGASRTGSSAGYSTSSLSDVPGVPQSFAACVAYRESTDLQNPAANGDAYGIIPASGYNVEGTSLANQKQVFAQLYAKYGTAPWAPSDGC